VDCGQRHVESLSEHAKGNSSRHVLSSQLLYLVLGEPSHPVHLSSRSSLRVQSYSGDVTPLPALVPHVVSMRANKQMFRVHAMWRVARVQHQLTFWDGTVCQLPSVPVGQNAPYPSLSHPSRHNQQPSPLVTFDQNLFWKSTATKSILPPDTQG